jgi:thiol-disulfide isomerase/thioredoxin
MPPKKQTQLQESVTTQDQWKALIEKDGLSIVDVYSAWCGSCKAVISLFRRLKNEIGDDLLRFALAASDDIEDLEPYQNRSEPLFLMYSAGVLVGVVRGAQAPLLEKTIKEKLDHEHKVLNGEAERIPVVDEGLNDVVIIPEDDDNEQDEQEEVTIEPVKKQISVLVIKPDAVQAGKADEIIEKLTENGYTILRNEERQLTKEEAAEFYKQHETSVSFASIKLM